MQQIDEAKLESDLGYRFGYLAEFIGFGADEMEVVHGAAPVLAPLVPGLVDAVYDKLFKYDATKRHFMVRQAGYDGEVPASLDELTQDHPMIQFRKQHLSRYLEALVTRPYDGSMAAYLDMVGKIHTRAAGNSEIVVPLVQMNVLMGFVADAFVQTIAGLGLDKESEVKALRAFNKLLWIQNDLISRHYAATN